MIFKKKEIIDLPYFKYHLNPFDSKVFESKKAKCPVCNLTVDVVYTGPFYSNHNIENICPWCIANGEAYKKYDGDFQDSQNIESEICKESFEELIHRTPGYISWQQAEWLVHCDEPCQFIGYVGWKEIEELKINVDIDVEKQANNYGISTEEFKERLFNEGSLQGYLFKCIKCNTYRLTTDCD